jgi:hypothetical protein
LSILSVQGCTWFDTVQQAADNAAAGEGGAGDGMRMDGSIAGAEAPAGEGGSAGMGSGRGGTGGIAGGGASGDGGVSGSGSGGASGSGGLGGNEDDDAGPDGPIDCESGCFDEPLLDSFAGHPEPRRFAVTDESTASGDQARVWLLARDEDGSHRLLSLRMAQTDASAWTDTGIDDVLSSPVGLSFADGDVQQQRVFFVRQDGLQMLTPNDGGEPEPFIVVPVPLDASDFSLSGGDLAAITFFVGEERRVAVLAPAAHDGTPGGYCVFELSPDGWATSCEAEPIMHAETDVEGVVVDGEAHFYFRSAANGLVRVARTEAGGYERSSVAVPEGRPVAPSFVAIASDVEGLVQLLVITHDGEVWSARLAASDRAAPAWSQLPPLMPGIRASTRQAVIAAVMIESFAPVLTEEPEHYRLVELRLIGEDGRLYHNITAKALSARPWQPGWHQVDDIGHDQYALAIGAIVQYRVDLGSSTYHLGNALVVTGAERATTLQETPSYLGTIFWRDRLRMETAAELATAGPVAELSAAAGGDTVVIAGALRGAQPPFNIGLMGSSDGASTYDEPRFLAPIGDPNGMSLSHPTLRYAGGAYHLVTLERELFPGCVEEPLAQRSIVYRTARDAEHLQYVLPGMTGYHVLVDVLEYLGNPVLGLTDGPTGVTAHVVYNAGTTSSLHYRRFDPLDPSGYLVAWLEPDHDMPAGPPVLATGLNEAVYVATADSSGFEVCQVPADARLSPSACSELSTFASPDFSEIAFGAPRDTAYGACAGDGPPYFACLRDDIPFAMAVDTSTINPTAHRVVVAYAADDGAGSSSIYVASSRGGDTIGGALGGSAEDDWIEAVRVSEPAEDAARRYFEPELTIDSRRKVTITYSAIDGPAEVGHVARAFVAQGEMDGNGRFSSFTQVELGTWQPEALPFDCVTQRAALGAYRQVETVGARALHVVRGGSSHNTRWLSEYASE